MVMEAPLGRPVTRRDILPATAPATAISEIPWTRIDPDLYEVARAGEVCGYVEVVGAVFVALGGARYDRAVEISQHLTFHSAVDVLVRRAR